MEIFQIYRYLSVNIKNASTVNKKKKKVDDDDEVFTI